MYDPVNRENINFRCSYDVKLTGEGKEISLRMHDFASASDHKTDFGFSVFI